MDATGTFELGGSRYEIVATKDMNYDEGVLVKKLSGGMAIGAYERGLVDADPDAWFAQVFVALRRLNPTIAPDKVLELMRNEKGGVVAIFRSVEREDQEDEPDPPASPPSSDTAANANGGNDGGNEHKSSEADRVTSGSQP